LVDRGNCTFLEKLALAKEAGASGVVVISDGEIEINPTAAKEELDEAGDISDVALVVLTRSEGNFIAGMVDVMNTLTSGQVKFIVHADHDDVPEPENGGDTNVTDNQNNDRNRVNRVLYLNGHPLLNTRLML